MNDLSSIDPEQFDDPLSNFEPVEYNNDLERALDEETVTAIEMKPFLSVPPETPIGEAVAMLHESNISSLLVVESRRLAGIFTERDVLERVSEQYDKLAQRPVAEVMTTDPTVVYESDAAGTALAAIAVAGHRHVPVVSADGEIRGIISPRRVFRFLDQRMT